VRAGHERRYRNLSFLTGTFELDGRLYSGRGDARRKWASTSIPAAIAHPCATQALPLRKTPMDEIEADRWHRLRPLLDRAIEIEGDARLAYLDGLQGDDAELKGELEQLLARHEQVKDRTPAIAIGLVTLAFSREDEAKTGLDDSDIRLRASRYPASESGPDRRDDTGSISRWFVADSGPKRGK
jgi:hypothetical protein